MTYERLHHMAFGDQLLETGDLDPVYIGLIALNLDEAQLSEWLIAYWAFYHCGIACALVEGGHLRYWDSFERHALRPRSERGTERRYFRGSKVPEALAFLRGKGQPVHWVQHLAKGQSFEDVAARVQEAPLFGPWIAFKAADMLERCAGVEVDFSGCELAMYEGPRKGALLIAEQEGWPADVPEVCTRLLRMFGDWSAPPYGDRLVNIQEIETILCKYKSHWTGHYPLGKDSREVREALHGWGGLAEKMAAAVPQEGSIKT